MCCALECFKHVSQVRALELETELQSQLLSSSLEKGLLLFPQHCSDGTFLPIPGVRNNQETVDTHGSWCRWELHSPGENELRQLINIVTSKMRFQESEELTYCRTL